MPPSQRTGSRFMAGPPATAADNYSAAAAPPRRRHTTRAAGECASGSASPTPSSCMNCRRSSSMCSSPNSRRRLRDRGSTGQGVWIEGGGALRRSFRRAAPVPPALHAAAAAAPPAAAHARPVRVRSSARAPQPRTHLCQGPARVMHSQNSAALGHAISCVHRSSAASSAPGPAASRAFPGMPASQSACGRKPAVRRVSSCHGPRASTCCGQKQTHSAPPACVVGACE